MNPDEKFYVCKNMHKSNEVNLDGIFSLGYFISEQIFNLNGNSKFKEIESLEEKEKILMFFKDKLKNPEKKDYHLKSLTIRYADNEELRKHLLQDQTIYLVDGIELDYDNLKSLDLIIQMSLDWDSIIILKDGIIKSFDSLSKNNNTNFNPNFYWLYLFGSFIYEEVFKDLADDDLYIDGAEIEELVYVTAFYVINGINKDFPDKLMKFLAYDDEGSDKNKCMFYKLLQKLDHVINRNFDLSHMNELNFVKELLIKFKQ